MPLTLRLYSWIVVLLDCGHTLSDSIKYICTNIKKVAPAVVWVAAILSNLLSLDRVFREDKENGTLEQIWLGGRIYDLVMY